MTFTPPKKRTHGQCTCYRMHCSTPNGSHDPDCPALYPLQPQPGDIPADVRANMDRLLTDRIARLEERLKGHETVAIITNDHLARALHMGQQQGRAELAAELLEMAPEARETFLERIVTEDN